MTAMELRVRRAVVADVGLLGPRLRAMDVREVEAVTAMPPAAALALGIETSKPCFAVVDADDQPVAIFGVQPAGRGAGTVWLLGSDELVQRPLLFLRESRHWLKRLHQSYPVLRAVADARNEVHLRWLAWCGFVHRRTLPSYGRQRIPFCEFESRADR
jgi:hypothetical protein